MSAGPSQKPGPAQPAGNSACFVDGCGNTMETKMMFKFPDKGERREAWCSALDVDPNLEVVGKSRLLKGAVVCEDHFVLEEDVENFMYSRLMGGKVKLKKSAVPRLAIRPKHEITVPAVEKRSSPVQETDHDLGVSDSLSASFHLSPSTNMLPYVKIKRLSAAEIVNAIYPTMTNNGIHFSKPRQTEVYFPPGTPRLSRIGMSNIFPRSAPAFSQECSSVVPLKVTPPNVTSSKPLPSKVTPLKTTLKVTPPNVTSLKPSLSKVTPLKTTQNMYLGPKTIPPSVAPLEVTPPNVTSNVTPLKPTQNISLAPKVSPLRVIQTNVDPHTESGFSDAVFKTPHVSAAPKAKFTCHHCSHKFVSLDAMRRHVALHIDLPYSKLRPRKNKFCIVPICYKSTEGNPDTLFFRAPKSLETWQKWNEIFGIVNVDYTKCKHTRFNVCEDHFYKRDIIVKGENVRLKKNALPKSSVAIKLKNLNSGAVSEKVESCTFADENKSEKRKLTRKRVKITPIPRGAQQVNVVDSVHEDHSTDGSAVGGVPGGQLKFVTVRRMVKSGLPGNNVLSSPEGNDLVEPIKQFVENISKLSPSPAQKRFLMPMSELVKSGLGKLVLDSPGETRLMMEQKQGYPTKKILRIIKLPPGTKMPDQLKVAHTVGSSNIGWTEAMNKKIASTAADLTVGDDVGEVETKVDEGNSDNDGNSTQKPMTPPNTTGPSQRITSPSATKLVQSGGNLILVRTKPLPPPTVKSNTDTAVQNSQVQPEKYRPGPKCFKSKRAGKPVRPSFKVNKPIPEIRFKVDPTDTNPAKLKSNKKPTTRSTKTSQKKLQTPQDVKPRNRARRGRTQMTKEEPKEEQVTKEEKGTIDLVIDSVIAQYMEAPTETQSPESTSTVVAAQNVKTQPKKYRPGPKCFKLKLEEKFVQTKESSLPGPKPISPLKTTDTGLIQTPAINSQPKTISVVGKRQRTKLSNEEIEEKLKTLATASMQSKEAHAEVTPTPESKPDQIESKCRPGPKCFKSKVEQKTGPPIMETPSPSQKLISPKSANLEMDQFPFVEPVLSNDKRIGNRQRTIPPKEALAPKYTQPPTSDQLIVITTSYPPNKETFKKEDTEANPMSESELADQIQPKKYRPGPKCMKQKLEEKTVIPSETVSLPGPKLTSPTNITIVTRDVEFKQPPTKSIRGKLRRTKSGKEFSAPAPEPVQSVTTLPHITSPNIQSEQDSAGAVPTQQSELETLKPVFVPKFDKPTTRHSTGKWGSLPGPKLTSPTNTTIVTTNIEFKQPQTKNIRGKLRRTKSGKESPAPAPESVQSVTTLPHITSPNIQSGQDSAGAVPTQQSELETLKPVFVPKFDKPTTRHSTGKLKKSRIFDDDYETDESPKNSPVKNSRSPKTSPTKNTRSSLGRSTLEMKINASRASTPHPDFVTPSPPAKRMKLVQKLVPALLDGVDPSVQSPYMAPRILLVLAKPNDNPHPGEFACDNCGETFHTKPQRKLHEIASAPSCALQGTSTHHSEKQETLRKMPTTVNAIKACLDVVDQIGVGHSASTLFEDPFEDIFPVVNQGGKAPTYDEYTKHIRDWSQIPVDPPSFSFRGLTPGFGSEEIGRSPFDYFLHFVTPEFLGETCAATNKCIQWVRSEIQCEDGPSVALLSVKELMSFLALVLLHFTVLGGVGEWLGDYGLPVDTCMTSNRFKFLLQVLSFSQQTDFKVPPLLEYFNERMKLISNPPKQLLLSDSAILQNDTLVYSRFDLKNSGCQGILYNLSAQDGTVHRICLKKDAVHPPGNNGFPNPVVDSLMDGLLDKGYSLYMNHFYCSVQLAEDLLRRKTYCTGTVCDSRMIAPSWLQRAMPEQFLVTGRSTMTTTSYYTEEGICFTKWDEGRECKCMSSEWGATMVGDGDFVRPALLHTYKEMTVARKGVPPMPRLVIMRCNTDVKLTLHILAMLIRNAYILFTKDNQTVTDRHVTFTDFHFEVVKHLLAYPAPVTLSPYIKSHLPTLIDSFRSTSVLMPRAMCDECEERATVTFCQSCPGNPRLCPGCYWTAHEEITILISQNPQKS